MSTSSPGVTVVVPTHERPGPLRRAVQSALDQAYAGPVEVLVVFDATEALLPPVEAPSDRTVRGIANTRTRGASGARNTGILAARHELVAFLDDDDRWLPGKLDRQVPALLAAPGSRLAATAMVVEEGARRHPRLSPSTMVTHCDLLRDRLAALHTSSFLARRADLAGDLGLFDEHFPRGYCEDYDLLLRASAEAPVLVVNEPLVEVTWQGRSHFIGQWETYADALQHLLGKHADLAAHRRGGARVAGQVGFALAAAGERRAGARWALRALRRDPALGRAWLALLVASGALRADWVVRAARRAGRGV